MDQSNTKPPEPEPRKPRTRKDRGFPPYRLPDIDSVAVPAPIIPKPPAAVHPELGEHDVKAEIIVKLSTRNGSVFNQIENAVMPGLLDPANQGIMARVVETQFAYMRDIAIRGFNKLIDDNRKPEVAPEKSKGASVSEMAAMQKAIARPVPKEPGELESGKPPYPTAPGTTFRPSLSPPPK